MTTLTSSKEHVLNALHEQQRMQPYLDHYQQNVETQGYRNIGT